MLQPTSGVLNRLLGASKIRPNPDYPFPIVSDALPEGKRFIPPLLEPPRGHVSILSGSGQFPNNWFSRNLVVPAGFSSAGWTMEARGIQQQTFLGGSIRSFNMNGGFGDSSSNLTVELVNDEFNKSDGTTYGTGIDEYHGGISDFILPPIPGTPVYFKFGENVATTEQAYRKVFDKIYGINTTGNAFNEIENYNFKDNNPNFTKYRYGPNGSPPVLNAFVGLKDGVTYNLESLRSLNSQNSGRGLNHVTFGGLLQSFLQNKGPGGNPTFSVQVTDPREVLSNVIVILNEYAESVYGEKNILNIYGFLEFNVSKSTNSYYTNNFGQKNLIIRETNRGNGEIYYRGSKYDLTAKLPSKDIEVEVPLDCYTNGKPDIYGYIKHFPITGTGMSRRSDQGIPWYRIKQGINALLGWYGPLVNDYKNTNFGGVINYKGYNYVVDFGGLPNLPSLYFIDFNQINLLDLCLEICDVTNRELFVSLLPVINHPACANIYESNKSNQSNKDLFISGIIRIDTIDRSKAPQYGAIKKYIDFLTESGLDVENSDIGYELANNVTNKFVAGAQEVQHYFFTSNHDRDYRSARSGSSQSVSMFQWLLEHQLTEQILPYYGLLGNSAVTIPKGWGAYQQILLDTTGLDANGVGAYYVATEMELRYASLSYKAWCDFLLQYNDKYFEKVSDDLIVGAAIRALPSVTPFPLEVPNSYAVGVPRSTFDTFALKPFGEDGLPASACNPPYGYPLYYKRATKIGIPQAGFTKMGSRVTTMINLLTTLSSSSFAGINDALNTLDQLDRSVTLSSQEKTYINNLKNAVKNGNINALNEISKGLHAIQASLPKLAKKGIENSMKIHSFLKKIADENLGKKFLVKIPKKINKHYSNKIKGSPSNYSGGPFGFKPIPANNYTNNISEFWSEVRSNFPDYNTGSFIKSFLLPLDEDNLPPSFCVGGLKSSFNPISYKFEFNYMPSNLGGFFDFDLYSNIYASNQLMAGNPGSLLKKAIPKGITQCLVPQDLTNFINSDGRVSPYVRFDHSEFLSLAELNSEDFSQQLITNNGLAMIPDLAAALDNTHDDKLSFYSMDSTKNDEKKPESCAFVKCSVDENFYMTTQFEERNINVYGAHSITNNVTKPVPIFIQCSGWSGGIPGTSLVPGTGCYVNSYKILEPHFIPTNRVLSQVKRVDFVRYQSKELNSYLINTSLESLNDNHVYALITLPNKIVPTQSTRYRESANFDKQHWDIHHYLTMDVVKGLPEFNDPPYFKTSGTRKFIDQFKKIVGPELLSKAWLAARAAKKNIKFGGANILNYTVPSPVYPDLVAIPLMSKERCYGPWISTYSDVQGFGFKDIGGKVEFTKDENLSPWQYGGYDLMNQAGVLQASFANNLLLFSERGGFSVPYAPSRSLCESLIEGGPLITNISVDVSSQGIKTTYKMDMYTPSFGKLQKQKQDSISKISRERQRIRDERNLIIRKGLMKSQTAYGIGNINLQASLEGISSNSLTYLVASNSINNQNGVAPILPTLSSDTFGASETSEDKPQEHSFINIEENINEASMTNIDKITEDSNQIDSYVDRITAMSDAGGIYLSEIFTPYAKSPYHETLPNQELFEIDSLKSKFGSDDKTTHFE